MSRLAAAAELDAVCDLLLSPTPDALDRCASRLEAAGRHLMDPSGSAGDARPVRRAWLRARALLENAARFHANWLAVRGALTGGYTGQGEPAPVRHPSRISVEA